MDGKGILIEGLKKRYGIGDTAVDALKGVDMHVAPGEVVGLIGPSGSGKSTLLKCLGAVIDPTVGSMTLGGEVIYDDGWKVHDLRALRRDKIGFVFQGALSHPLYRCHRQRGTASHAGGSAQRRGAQARPRPPYRLDVQHRAKAMPSQLSGGEQQRVAIARGLSTTRRCSWPMSLRHRWIRSVPWRHSHPQRHGAQVRDRRHCCHPRRENHPHLQAHLHFRDGVTHEEAAKDGVSNEGRTE